MHMGCPLAHPLSAFTNHTLQNCLWNLEKGGREMEYNRFEMEIRCCDLAIEACTTRCMTIRK